jgi:hypothetical protein
MVGKSRFSETNFWSANIKRESSPPLAAFSIAIGSIPKFAENKKELSILEEKDFSSYMLIVADYINWAKSNKLIVYYNKAWNKY